MNYWLPKSSYIDQDVQWQKEELLKLPMMADHYKVVQSYFGYNKEMQRNAFAVAKMVGAFDALNMVYAACDLHLNGEIPPALEEFFVQKIQEVNNGVASIENANTLFLAEVIKKTPVNPTLAGHTSKKKKRKK